MEIEPSGAVAGTVAGQNNANAGESNAAQTAPARRGGWVRSAIRRASIAYAAMASDDVIPLLVDIGYNLFFLGLTIGLLIAFYPQYTSDPNAGATDPVATIQPNMSSPLTTPAPTPTSTTISTTSASSNVRICEKGVLVYLYGQIVLCAFYALPQKPLQYYLDRYRPDLKMHWSIRWINRFWVLMMLFDIAWFISGQVWVYHSPLCKATDPVIFWLAIVQIGIFYMVMVIPLVIIILLTLLASRYGRHRAGGVGGADQPFYGGLSKQELDSLRTFFYKPATPTPDHPSSPSPAAGGGGPSSGLRAGKLSSGTGYDDRQLEMVELGEIKTIQDEEGGVIKLNRVDLAELTVSAHSNKVLDGSKSAAVGVAKTPSSVDITTAANAVADSPPNVPLDCELPAITITATATTSVSNSNASDVKGKLPASAPPPPLLAPPQPTSQNQVGVSSTISETPRSINSITSTTTNATTTTTTNVPEAPLPPNAPSNCSICFCDFEAGDRIRELACGHLFHADCIDPWLIAPPVVEEAEAAAAAAVAAVAGAVAGGTGSLAVPGPPSITSPSSNTSSLAGSPSTPSPLSETTMTPTSSTSPSQPAATTTTHSKRKKYNAHRTCPLCVREAVLPEFRDPLVEKALKAAQEDDAILQSVLEQSRREAERNAARQQLREQPAGGGAAAAAGAAGPANGNAAGGRRRRTGGGLFRLRASSRVRQPGVPEAVRSTTVESAAGANALPMTSQGYVEGTNLTVEEFANIPSKMTSS